MRFDQRGSSRRIPCGQACVKFNDVDVGGLAQVFAVFDRAAVIVSASISALRKYQEMMQLQFAVYL